MKNIRRHHLKEPHVFILIRFVTTEEAYEFKSLITSTRSRSTGILYEFLDAHKQEAWSVALRNEVFTLIFRKAYRIEKDYLLRNRFRILHEKLESFLVQKEMKKSLHDYPNLRNYYLLKSLKKRKVFDLFQVKYKTALLASERSWDYQTAVDICGIALVSYRLFSKGDNASSREARELCDRQHRLISALYLNRLLQNRFDGQWINAEMDVCASETRKDEDHLLGDLTAFRNPFSEYLEQKVLLRSLPGGQRIQALRKNLKRLDKLGRGTEELKNEWLFCQISLATELTLRGDHAQANLLYLRLLQSEFSVDFPIARSVVLNNLIHLYYLKTGEQPLQPIAAGGPALMGNYHHMYIDNMAEAGILALLRNARQLKEKLPQNLRGLPDHLKQAYRFYYSIYYYLSRHFDEAFREMVNFRQAKRLKIHPLDVRQLVTYFYRFYGLLKKEKGEVRHNADRVRKLLIDVRKYQVIATPEMKGYLPLYWLEKEIGSYVTAT